MPTLELDDVKVYLNITGESSDVELQAIIDAAEAAISAKCGPLAATPVGVLATASSGTMVLSVLPAIELTAVVPVEGGDPLDLGDMILNGPAGVVSGVPTGTYTVIYSAGRETCPPDLLLAVKELVRHLWESQRGGSKRPGSTVSDATSNTIPGAAYLFPFRVSALIAPHLQPGFA